MLGSKDFHMVRLGKVKELAENIQTSDEFLAPEYM